MNYTRTLKQLTAAAIACQRNLGVEQIRACV